MSWISDNHLYASKIMNALQDNDGSPMTTKQEELLIRVNRLKRIIDHIPKHAYATNVLKNIMRSIGYEVPSDCVAMPSDCVAMPYEACDDINLSKSGTTLLNQTKNSTTLFNQTKNSSRWSTVLSRINILGDIEVTRILKSDTYKQSDVAHKPSHHAVEEKKYDEFEYPNYHTSRT